MTSFSASGTANPRCRVCRPVPRQACVAHQDPAAVTCKPASKGSRVVVNLAVKDTGVAQTQRVFLKALQKDPATLQHQTCHEDTCAHTQSGLLTEGLGFELHLKTACPCHHQVSY